MEDTLDENDNSNTKFNFGIWKKIFAEFGYYKHLLIFGIMLGGLAGLTEITEPILTKYIIDNYINEPIITDLTPVIIAMVIFCIITGSITFSFIKLIGSAEIKMCDRLRKKMFSKLQSLSISYYDKRAVGYIMARMSSDINKLSESVSWGLMDSAFGLFMMIGVVIVMIKMDIKLALIVIATMPIILLFSIFLYGKILKSQRKVRKINSELTAAYNEDIQGAKTTKTLVREAENLDEFMAKTSRMKKAQVRAIAVSSVLMPTVQLIGSIGYGIIVSYGGSRVLAGGISIGLLVAFTSYVTRFNFPLIDAAGLFAEFISAQAAAERIFSLLGETSDIKDTEESIAKYGTILEPTEEVCPKIKGDVVFENVSFYYNEEEPVITDLNLKVQSGQTIALVGATGAGKSTIVNLFCRFYEPKKGRILVDGIDYTTMPERWIHENLGYVLQAPHLFSGTIRENIRYGNESASEEQIIEAAKLANAHDFIMRLKDGYDTDVGEGGSLLSIGQKQLISFARAILRDPQLFVLDEATSSIDTETEKQIQNSIAYLLKNRTSFVVAHRLSTIRNADKILYIDNGKIAEQGTHTELMQKKGAYYNLYTKQFINEQIENMREH